MSVMKLRANTVGGAEWMCWLETCQHRVEDFLGRTDTGEKKRFRVGYGLMYLIAVSY